MKKSLLVLSSLAMVASLFGCNKKTSTSTPSAVDSTSASVVSTSAAETVGVEFKSKVTEVEAKQSITLRAVAYNLDGSEITDDSVDFTSSDENEDYVTLPDNTTGVTSLKITGVKKGTVTITATSHIKKTAFASVEITIVPVKNGLATVMTKVAGLTNYTFTSTYKDDNDADVTLSTVKRTAATLTQTVKDSKGVENDLLTSTDKSYTIHGLGIGSDGYAVYLKKNATTGAYMTNTTRIATDGGFLTAKNFAGFGTNAFSVADNGGTFHSLCSFAPAWFPTTKSADNTYVIAGSAEAADQHSAYIEYMIWEMMDPANLAKAYDAAYNAATTDAGIFGGVSADIVTTFTVIDNTTIQVTLEENETYGNRTLTGTMSAVDTTADDADVTAVLTGTTVAPALSSALSAIETASKQTVFAASHVIYAENPSNSDDYVALTYWDYFTDKYYFTYFDPALRAAYKAKATTDILNDDGTVASSGGYIVKSDGLHQITYVDPVYDTDGTTIKTPASITVDSSVVSGTSEVTKISDLGGPFNLSGMLEESGIFYTFGSTAADMFGKGTKYYHNYTNVEDAIDPLTIFYFGSSQYTGPKIGTLLKVATANLGYAGGVAATYDTTDTTKITELKWQAAVGDVINNKWGAWFFTQKLGTVAPDGIDALITAKLTD